MFFGAVENFERALLETHSDPDTLIIRLRRVPFMDITGIQTLEEVVGELQNRDVRVLLCEANDRVLAKLSRAGVLIKLGSEGYASEFGEAIAHADRTSLSRGQTRAPSAPSTSAP
jgi:SulP family sulfate permease